MRILFTFSLCWRSLAEMATELKQQKPLKGNGIYKRKYEILNTSFKNLSMVTVLQFCQLLTYRQAYFQYTLLIKLYNYILYIKIPIIKPVLVNMTNYCFKSQQHLIDQKFKSCQNSVFIYNFLLAATIYKILFSVTKKPQQLRSQHRNAARKAKLNFHGVLFIALSPKLTGKIV